MSAQKIVDYEIRLRISGWWTGFAERLGEEIRKVLTRGTLSEGQVEVLEVKELPPAGDALTRPPVETAITPLSALYFALPERFQTPEILDGLSARYHQELSWLWQSVGDERCRSGVVRLEPWEKGASQWICFFESRDRSAPKGNEYNWHGQNTSQWKNRSTGWQGHQGAIVFDESNGRISSHH